MEVWRNIVGFQPYYQVSNTGRVKSLARATNDNGGIFHRKERILSQHKDRNGYLFVDIYDLENKKRKIHVHRLVALAFIPNPDNKPETDHIDGSRDKNIPSNLRWVTHTENMNNPHSVKRQKVYVQEKARHKRSIVAYNLKGKKIGEWPTITMAAEATSTCRHSISSAANGKYQTANDLIWKYNG